MLAFFGSRIGIVVRALDTRKMAFILFASIAVLATVTRLIDGAKARVKKVRETDDDETQSGARHEEAGAG